MKSPYQDGYDAAFRQGDWVGCNDPQNPYPKNSESWGEWEAGFDEGCGDHWELWKLGET